MKLSQFKFSINENLLASHPSANRDESRLMVIDRATGKIEHKVFKDILNYFGEDDVLITNNTKVFPARLYGNKEKTGAKIEAGDKAEEDEAALVARARTDPDAFGQLYESYVDRVYSYIYHRVGNVQDAEDLTARTFHRALEKFDSYEDRGLPFSAWLFRIARNRCHDHHRSRSQRNTSRNRPLEASRVDQLSAPGLRPDENAADSEELRKLREAIAALEAKVAALESGGSAPDTAALADEVAARVQVQEHSIYPLVVQWFCEGRLKMQEGAALLDGAELGPAGYASE